MIPPPAGSALRSMKILTTLFFVCGAAALMGQAPLIVHVRLVEVEIHQEEHTPIS